MSKHEQIDMAAIMRELSEIKRRLDGIDGKPRPEWISQAEYAQMHGVTTRTVRNWASAGEIETYRNGAKMMVRVNPTASPSRRQSH